MSSRYITDTDKLKILERQKYRCANVPGANLYRLGDWPCLLWEGTRNGVFMDDMYEFDHIVEFSLTKDNSIDNIQLLCPNCHSRRTKDFVKELALAKRKGIINDYSGNDGNFTPVRKYQKRKVKPIYFSNEEIIAVDECGHSIKSLLIKQKRRELDETEQCILRKLKLIKSFGITNTVYSELLEDFLREYISREVTFRRFEYFFGYVNNGTANDKRRRKIIVNMLNLLLEEKNTTYEPDDLNIEISGPEYDKRLTKIIKESIYFAKEGELRILFFQPNGKNQLFSNENKQHYTNTIQSVLRIYGIIFKASKRVRYCGKLGYQYLLSVDEQIRNTMNLKHGLPSVEGQYDELF